MLTLMFIVIITAILFVMSRDNRSNSQQQQQEGIMHSITSSKVRWTMWLIVAVTWISYNVVTLPYIMDNGINLSSMRLVAEMIQIVVGAGVVVVGYINLMLHLMVWLDERRHTPRVPLYAKMYRWVKHVLPILVVILLTVGCEADHGVRMKALTDEGYPSHCQRDTNQDGWHTLEEGASVMYKDLGPCPTCLEYGIVPVYTSNTDTTWSVDSQWKKQTLEALELESIQFPYHVCEMEKEEWDSYRLMKWDYESSIWWRGTLLGLEKMSHMEVQATEECTSRRPVKESGIMDLNDPLSMMLLGGLLIGLLLTSNKLIKRKEVNKMKNLLKELRERFTRMRQMWHLVGQGGGIHRYNDTCPMCTKHTQSPTSVVTMLSASMDRGYDRTEAQAHKAELIDQGISYPVCLDCAQSVALTLCDSAYREENGFDQEIMLEQYKGKCWRYGLKLSVKELFQSRSLYYPEA